MPKKLSQASSFKYLLAALLVALSLAVIVIWLMITMQIFYREKIYPGIWVGDIDLGGKTELEAKAILMAKTKALNNGVEFSYGDKKSVLSPSSVSFSGDLAYQLFALDLDKTVAAAWAIGRHTALATDWQQRLGCWFWGCSVPLAVDYNQPKIVELLKQEFASFESPAANAALVWRPDGSWTISPEKFGHRFDYQAATALFLNNLSQAKNDSIKLILEEDAPQIFSAEVGDLSPAINSILQAAPLTFKFNDPAAPKGFDGASKSWMASKNDVRLWLALKADYQNGGKNIVVDIDDALLATYLDKRMGAEINQAPLEAKFAMADGRVTLFQSARDGQAIDATATAQAIRQALATGSQEIALAVKVTKSELTANNFNSLGINEIIGTGTSSFAGSPPNRRHNIAVGAAAINGLLIKPGEEFSLVKALGDINAKTGYLTELVIKENKTVPEYGGGLCQIGTTMFRTALASGLPITMRVNHSYRVGYYEPAGTDATIYDPWPDLRFINDTGNYILIQTRLEGDEAIFDFWGKKDGRTVGPIKPAIYNITKPPPGKVVETLNLKPGVKKCTERAHNGADTWFDYKVTYPSGEVKDKKFSSHYVPWQEVCLIGVKQLSTPTEAGNPLLLSPDAANIVAPTSTTP
jgi:vancomycin resistance protein YoaR